MSLRVVAKPHWNFTTPHSYGDPHNALRAFNAGLSLYQSKDYRRAACHFHSATVGIVRSRSVGSFPLSYGRSWRTLRLGSLLIERIRANGIWLSKSRKGRSKSLYLLGLGKAFCRPGSYRDGHRKTPGSLILQGVLCCCGLFNFWWQIAE